MTDPLTSSTPHWWTLPNKITVTRLVLALVVLGCLELGWYAVGTAVFVVAASTDWVDGYLARRYGLVTKLGRILDPFVDKLLVCAVFIYLAIIPESGIPGWLAVVVMARELLITALRGEIEGRGGDFSARWSGKWKMAIQCVTATLAMLGQSWWWERAIPAYWNWLMMVAVIATTVVTVHSGVVYVWAATHMLRRTAV